MNQAQVPQRKLLAEFLKRLDNCGVRVRVPRHAVLAHVPWRIRSSSDTSPVLQAAVAPPLLRLWSERRSAGRPAARVAFFHSVLSKPSGMARPSIVVKRGAVGSTVGETSIILSRLETGQNALPGMRGSMTDVASCTLCIVFDHLTLTLTPPGTLVMSPLVKWRLGSKPFSVGGARFDCLNSPVKAKASAQGIAGSTLARAISSSCSGDIGSLGLGMYLELVSIDLRASCTLYEPKTDESKSSLLNAVDRDPIIFLMEAGLFMFGLMYCMNAKMWSLCGAL